MYTLYAHLLLFSLRLDAPARSRCDYNVFNCVFSSCCTAQTKSPLVSFCFAVQSALLARAAGQERHAAEAPTARHRASQPLIALVSQTGGWASEDVDLLLKLQDRNNS